MAEIEDDYEIRFELGEPYLPYEQLLAVLPIASSNCLPVAYRNLMLKESSPLHKYYPLEFEIDMNFSTVPWGGVALLPWINEKLLKRAVASVGTSHLTVEFFFVAISVFVQFVWFFFCFAFPSVLFAQV